MSEGVFASFAISIRPPRQGEVHLVGMEAQILLLLLLPLPLLFLLPPLLLLPLPYLSILNS